MHSHAGAWEREEIIDFTRIRRMEESGLSEVAAILKVCFPRQGHSSTWVTSNFGYFPRIQYFVAEVKSELVAFIAWSEKSGFRNESVMELEQIAVLPKLQRKGLGRKLILRH